jgi:predicted MFS family arabinose efflux permease
VLGGELPLTQLTRRHPRPAMAAGLLLVGAGFAVNALARAPLPLTGGVLIWTLGEMLVFPIANGYWAEYASAATRGRYAGAYNVAWAVGNSLAPGLGGAAFARNPTALWLSCGVLGMVAATLLLRSAPRNAPPTTSISRLSKEERSAYARNDTSRVADR